MKATKVKPAVDKLKEAQKWRNHKPKYQPPTIEKLEQNIERIKKIKDDKEKAAKEADAKEKAKLKEREEVIADLIDGLVLELIIENANFLYFSHKTPTSDGENSQGEVFQERSDSTAEGKHTKSC